MTEETKPKRKRTYEGEQLERRRAYQRQYNAKKRAEEKAAKHRPLKPIEVANARQRPPQGKSGEKAEMAQFSQKWLAKTTDVDTYRALLEEEEKAAVGGWNDSGKEWFWERVEGAGE